MGAETRHDEIGDAVLGPANATEQQRVFGDAGLKVQINGLRRLGLGRGSNRCAGCKGFGQAEIMFNFRGVGQSGAQRDFGDFIGNACDPAKGSVFVHPHVVLATDRAVGATCEVDRTVDFLIADPAVNAEVVVELVAQQSRERVGICNRRGAAQQRRAANGVVHVNTPGLVEDQRKGQLLVQVTFVACAKHVETVANITGRRAERVERGARGAGGAVIA